MKPATNYWRGILRNWPVLVLCSILGGAGGFAYATFGPQTYTSTSQVVIVVESLGTPNDRLAGSSYVQSMMPTYTAAVTSTTVLDPVIASLDLSDTVEELRRDVKATSNQGTALITITATSDTAQNALDLAEAVTEEFVTAAPTLISPNAEPVPVVTPSPESAAVPNQPNSQTVPATIIVTTVSAAALPATPDTPSVVLTTVLGLISGLIIGIGVALILTAVDTRVRTVADIERASGAPVIARLPVMSRRGWAGRAGNADWTTALRSLRESLFDWGETSRAIQFTSASPGVGVTSIVADLARSLAGAGVSVIAVDTSISSPGLNRHFDVAASPGLAEILERAQISGQVAHVIPSAPSLRVVAAGARASQADLLAGSMLGQVIAEFVQRAETVLLDSQSMGSGSDALSVSKSVQTVVLVVALGRVTESVLLRQLELLERSARRPAAIVAIRVPRSAMVRSTRRAGQ